MSKNKDKFLTEPAPEPTDSGTTLFEQGLARVEKLLKESDATSDDLPEAGT